MDVGLLEKVKCKFQSINKIEQIDMNIKRNYRYISNKSRTIKINLRNCKDWSLLHIDHWMHSITMYKTRRIYTHRCNKVKP